MRTLLRVTMDHAAGNAAIKDGRLPKLMEETNERLRPEASYFCAHNGKRSANFIFDLKDPSDIPSIAEPFFTNLGADIEFTPVMNADDLKRGLEKVAATMEKTPARG